MEFLNKSSRNQENVDKLPFFLNNAGSPKSWFQLLEAKYEFSAMSSSNKFYQSLSGLPPDILKLLADELVEASISCNPYNCLKELVIEHFKVKPNEIISSYFAKCSIGDMKPSEFLEKSVKELETRHPGITKDNDKAMRNLFISRLPSDVQKIVNGISNIELSKLADFADKICDKTSANSVETDDKFTISSLSTEITSLKFQVQTLQEKVVQLERKVNQKSKKFRQKSPIKMTSLSSSPKNSSEIKVIDKNTHDLKLTYDDNNHYESYLNFKELTKCYMNDKNSYESNFTINDKSDSCEFCYYHIKYGSAALKCQLGCAYKPKTHGLKVSNICIYHARNSSDSSQCVHGCSHYSYNDKSSR